MKKIIIFLLMIGLLFRVEFLLLAKEKSPEALATLTLGEIKQLRSEYHKLKADINRLETILDDIIAKVMSCKLKRYNTDGYKRQIEKLRIRLYYLENELKRIEKDIEKVLKKRDELNEKLYLKNMNINSNKNAVEFKKNQRKETQNEIPKKEEMRDYLAKRYNKLLSDRRYEQYIKEYYDYRELAKETKEKFLNAKNDSERKRLGEELNGYLNRIGICEKQLKLPGYSNIDEEIEKMRQDVDKLKKENEILEVEIKTLQSEIDKLKDQIAKLSSVLDKYKKIKSDIIDLKIELMKLQQKINLLDKLKPIKEKLIKEKDPEKRKHLKEKMDVIYQDFLKIKNILEDLKQDPEKETKIKTIGAKIIAIGAGKWAKRRSKEIEKEIKKAWDICFMWSYSSTEMKTVNDYIGWINNTYHGNIPEINSVSGGSVTLIYRFNNTIGAGISYDHLQTRSDGTLVISPPPTTLDHSHKISTNGFLGVLVVNIPLGIKHLDFNALAGAGVYLSKYDETENGFNITGKGTDIGYKAGVYLNYTFLGKFGICGEVCYRSISVNRFKDSAGEILKFVPGYGAGNIQADLIGFGFSIGISFRL